MKKHYVQCAPEWLDFYDAQFAEEVGEMLRAVRRGDGSHNELSICRYYSSQPAVLARRLNKLTKVFLDITRKCDDCVWKSTCGVRKVL